MEQYYTPVVPVYYELIEFKKEKDFAKAYYFGKGNDLEEAS